MAGDIIENRSEPRDVPSQYYSVDFAVGDDPSVYQFKIWNLSPKGACFIVKEDSAVLKHLKVGDRLKMRYFKTDAPSSSEFLNTEIRHMTKDEHGRFRGHYKIGISIFSDPKPTR